MIKINTIKCLAVFLLLFLFGCEQNKKRINTTIAPQCLSSQSKCLIESIYGDFSVLFNVNRVVTENEFKIELISHGLSKIESVSAYIEGKNMFMGKIPLFFEPLSDTTVAKMTANTMLGSCSEVNMRWIIYFTVNRIEENGDIVSDKFSVEFDSVRA